jgi:hypothetical protein
MGTNLGLEVAGCCGVDVDGGSDGWDEMDWDVHKKRAPEGALVLRRSEDQTRAAMA